MVTHKPMPRRATPTPATRQRQKIVMLKQCCKMWPQSMPALMNTWRPKHDQESDDEYRQRVVEAGDGDVLRGMQIMHRAHTHQNAIIRRLLLLGADSAGVRAVHCSVCGRQEYLFDEEVAAAAEPVCYTCAYVREDTREWLNQKTPVSDEPHPL